MKQVGKPCENCGTAGYLRVWHGGKLSVEPCGCRFTPLRARAAQ